MKMIDRLEKAWQTDNRRMQNVTNFNLLVVFDQGPKRDITERL